MLHCATLHYASLRRGAYLTLLRVALTCIAWHGMAWLGHWHWHWYDIGLPGWHVERCCVVLHSTALHWIALCDHLLDSITMAITLHPYIQMSSTHMCIHVPSTHTYVCMNAMCLHIHLRVCVCVYPYVPPFFTNTNTQISGRLAKRPTRSSRSPRTRRAGPMGTCWLHHLLNTLKPRRSR